MGKPALTLSKGAENALMTHPWPGNVRELGNTLERAAIIATLKAVGGNRRRASEKLGIGERTLYRKLKEYEIES